MHIGGAFLLELSIFARLTDVSYCTNCVSCQDLSILHGSLCTWPTNSYLSDHGLEEMTSSILLYH